MVSSDKRCVILLALTCACGSRVPAKPLPETALVPASPRLVGRFDTSDAAGPRFSWSGTAMEARFRGAGVAIRLRVEAPPVTGEKTVPYAVRIDDGPVQRIAIGPDRELYELARGLDPAREHLAVVTREAEAFAGVHQFRGFEVPPGGELLPARPARKRIEVLGDSITCGYGALGDSASCGFSFATETAVGSYAAIAAQKLDADLVTVCWSGRGVYRNFAEGGDLALDLFEKAAPPLASTWKHEPAPDVFVINLGTNDLFSKSGPFEPAKFEAAYAKILARVREVHEGVPILAAVPAMLEGEHRAVAKASLERVVAKANDPKIELLVFSEQGALLGCDGHPNVAKHAENARELEAAATRALGAR